MLLSMLEAALTDGADVVNNSWGGGAGGNPNGSVYEDVLDSHARCWRSYRICSR